MCYICEMCNMYVFYYIYLLPSHFSLFLVVHSLPWNQPLNYYTEDLSQLLSWEEPRINELMSGMALESP